MRIRPAATNVVLFIGDGLGYTQLACARYLAGEYGATLALDALPVWGQVATHSAAAIVTDSAAAGTAWATGVKTRNGHISVDPHGQPLPTILEYAQAAGMATGLVATSRITYATPAVHAAHVADRSWEGPADVGGASYLSIAEQYLAGGIDVLLGGGGDRFPPELLARAAMLGYELPTTAAALRAATAPRLLGLFTPGHMAYEGERPAEQPSLAEMTRAALRTLRSNPEGFFLLVEGARIDHAAHVGDFENMLGDLRAFDQAVAVALAATGPETLVVVTADHETGGLILLADPVAALPGVPVISLESTHGALHLAWTTGGHTAQPVPVAAAGPGAAAFAGCLDNTDLFHAMRAALGLAHAPPPVILQPIGH